MWMRKLPITILTIRLPLPLTKLVASLSFRYHNTVLSALSRSGNSEQFPGINIMCSWHSITHWEPGPHQSCLGGAHR